MVRARLWPATPKYPRLAFSFELLDLAEALLLECQVALKDLCKALQFMGPRLVTKVYCLLMLYILHSVIRPLCREGPFMQL